MASDLRMLETARDVLRTEAQAIMRLCEKLNDSFMAAIELILACKGRVVVTGVGKSGLICKKIAATLASTGTPAFFLHAGDAIHGDLGMIVRGDVVLALSNSGKTYEILHLLPLIKRLGVKLISLTGDLHSELALASDVIIDVSVENEACPLGLAPTASTTAALALGDAIALVLLQRHGFQETDFADLHPGGRLGKRLLRVKDLMKTGADLPIVQEETLMKEAIFEMTSKGLGVTTVVDPQGALAGILTDGDLRRALAHGIAMLDHQVQRFMTRKPKLISKEELAAEAVQIMEQHAITCLLIVDAWGKPEGVIKLQDILISGVV